MRTLVAWTISTLLFLWGFAAEPAFCRQDEHLSRQRAPDAVAPDRNGDPDPTAGMTDIHDIKNLADFPGLPFYAKASLTASAVLLALLSICMAVHYYSKRKKKRRKSPTPVSPEEAALKTLGEIRNLMDTDGKSFYFRLSLALREYIGEKFSVNAAEMTTEELSPTLKSFRLADELESGTLRFFEYGDRVKFAGAVPERAKMERHFEFVRLFVKTTAENSRSEDDLPVETHASENGSAARISESA